MQGRLIGKRFQAEFFLEGAIDETHGCDYLLANDIDMEPVPGYEAANWDKGYGDFVMKPDLTTLMKATWLEGTALILCRPRRPPSSRADPAQPARHAEGAAGAAREDGAHRQLRLASSNSTCSTRRTARPTTRATGT